MLFREVVDLKSALGGGSLDHILGWAVVEALGGKVGRDCEDVI